MFLVTNTPYRELNNYEALRTSMALYDHEVTILWMGDGVFFPLKMSEKNQTQPFLRLMKDLNVRLLIDVDELVERGFSSDDLISEAVPMPHDALVGLLAEADAVLSF